MEQKSKGKEAPPSVAAPAATSAYAIDRQSICYRIFSNYLNRQYKAAISDLVNVVQELKIDTKSAPNLFLEHLPKIVAAFVNSWVGWQFEHEYRNGKFGEDLYFQRFRKNLIFQLNGAVKTQFRHAFNSLPPDVQEVLNGARVSNAQRTLELDVKCPASMLNTLVFETDGDDIILKHHVEAPWQALAPHQIVNWPFVKITFNSQFFSFVRTERSDIRRYLNLGKKLVGCNLEKKRLLSMDSGKQPVACYSYNYVSVYVTQYIQLLTAKAQNKNHKQSVDVVKAVLQNFLLDASEIRTDLKENKVFTNVRVHFMLTNRSFSRNKKLTKMSADKDGTVALFEEIHPQAELIITNFSVKQIEPATAIMFHAVECLKPLALEACLPQIMFECTFCRVQIGTYELLVQHLRIEHKMGQPVRCTACKKLFSFPEMLEKRWKHDCSSKSEES